MHVFNTLVALLNSISGCTLTNDYDYMILVQTWQPTICSEVNICKNVNDIDFNIHGLWPQNFDGSYPCYCDKNAIFNIDNFTPTMIHEMNYEWGSYICEFSDVHCNSHFWSHEWLKHGTCANIGNQTEYFNEVLDIKTEYQYVDILHDVDIYQSNTELIKLADFYNALIDKIGVLPEVTCIGEYITGITLCFNKDVKLIDCPDSSPMRCTNDMVIWPESVINF